MKEVKISVNQLTVLTVMSILGTAIVFLPSTATAYGGVNGWMTILLATGFGSLLAVLYTFVFQLDTSKDVFQLMDDVLGKWLGKLAALLFISYVFISTSGNIWGMGLFLTTQILVETPMEAIGVLVIIVAMFGVRMGIEVISRSAEIFFPYTLIALVLLVALVSPEAEVTNIQPVLQTDIGGTIMGVLPVTAITFLELVVLLALFHQVDKPKQVRKGLLTGVLIAGSLLTIITLICIFVLGAEITTRHTYPTYVVGKKISIANFLERIEVIVAIAWFFTIFFKITISFYIVNKGLSQVFNLKNANTLTLPLAYILFVSAMVHYPNNIVNTRVDNSTWILFSLTTGLLLPAAVLLTGIIKNRISR